MNKLLVIGSANVDMVMGLRRLPEKGETVTDGQFLRTFGGKGANQAVAAQRAGAAVTFVTCLGEDADGDAVHAVLAQEGIDLAWVARTASAPTGAAIVLFDADGANYLAVAPGSNYELREEHLANVFANLQRFSWLLLQFEIAEETLHAALAAAAAARLPVLLNYAPARAMTRSLTPSLNVALLVNELEAESITGLAVRDSASAMAAARVLYSRGFRFAIVTIGAQGACLASPEGELHVPALAVTAVDSTAAGDTFCGALAVALAEGGSLTDAARFATAAASISVQRAGAQPSIPRRDEIDAVMGR